MSYNTFQDLSFIEELPKNWDVRKFSDIFTDVSGGNVKLQKSDFQTTGKYPIIDQGQSFIAGYTSDTNALCNTTLPVIVFGDHTRAFKYISFKFVMGADGTKVLQPNGDAKVEVKYVYHFLKSVKLPDKGYSRHFKYLKDVALPLPPLSEQKRIAAILDKAEEIKRKREESLKLADEFLKSVFVDMFGDPVTNPKGWEMKTAIDFAQCIVPGRDKPKSFSGGIPWVTTNDLKHLGYTSESHIGLADNEIQEVRARIIPENSVIITCVGDLGIATISKVKMVINQQLHAFQCKENMNNIFFMYAISFQKSYMYSRATKTTVPYMNKSVCNSIPMIYPPAHLQQKFANIFEVVNSQRELMSKSFNYTTSIFSSLSHYAFRGKI